MRVNFIVVHSSPLQGRSQFQVGETVALLNVAPYSAEAQPDVRAAGFGGVGFGGGGMGSGDDAAGGMPKAQVQRSTHKHTAARP